MLTIKHARTNLIACLFCVVAIVGHAQPFPDTRIIQAADMQGDFNYLRKALEETHPGLYMHHTKAEMQKIMDSLYSRLDKPLPFLDFYAIIAHLISEVKCEHTYCNAYSDGYKKLVDQCKLVPMQMSFQHNKVYVVVNRTTDTSIHPGYEVLSINHYPIDSIKRSIYKYMPSDGYMEASKDQQLSSMLFSVYYYLFIERPDTFTMEFKNERGEILERHWNKDLLLTGNKPLALANPVNKPILDMSARYQKQEKDPWRYEFFKEKNTAILTIRSFLGNREKLFKFYDTFFKKLKKEKTGNLVVNLSYNGGGDEEFACELLSYFISSPTQFIENEYLISLDTAWFKKSNLPPDALEHLDDFVEPGKDGRFYAKPQTKYSKEIKVFEPKPNRFEGKVYFYVNGVTSSAASTCAALAQSYKLATIVGEETAGSFAGGGTTNGLDLVLPASKISAHTSIVYCKFATSGRNKDRGVVPDHYFVQDFQDIISGKINGWQEFILGLIEKEKR